MTEVRIRHENDDASISLGDIPFGEIESVIPLLKRWGLYIRELDKSDALSEASDFYANFVLDQDSAYFEVVVA